MKYETDLREVILGAQHECTLIHSQHPHKGIGLGGDGDVHLAAGVHQVWRQVHCHLQHHGIT